ncbi:hypothetical protein [Ochrovirga pacifica]|uniref:hypothetical protein n=1 Tax=Ochrovirga pacifica TaxID=1042376 RepID=UPI0002558012|nr:hypothetical protein [Ochrovirga pacifica]
MKHCILFFSFFLIQQLSFAQCAMCKAVVENGDSGLAEGLNDGIVTLMIIPYILVAIVAFVLYRYFKANKEQV